jgi:hypothetical protein
VKLDYAKIEDVDVDVSWSDWPDLGDSSIQRFTYCGREATEDELTALNDDHDYVYEAALAKVF